MWLSTLPETLSTIRLRGLAYAASWRPGRRAGQGLVEYSLLLVLIMVTCVVIVGTVGKTLYTVWYSKLVPMFG
jgi:hypothetical protein